MKKSTVHKLAIHMGKLNNFNPFKILISIFNIKENKYRLVVKLITITILSGLDL